MTLLPVSIGIGLVVCLIFAEWLGLSAGGMVVPGYLALSLDHPAELAVTLGLAVATHALVGLLAKGTILYGRRRVGMTILIAFTLGYMVAPTLETWLGFPGWIGTGEDSIVIGFIIPGLIAISMDRQGVIETCSALAIASVFVRLALIVLLGETSL